MATPTDHLADITRAAELIHQADAMLVAAGAGMGVDSGLPAFRGPEGFWRAYPALKQAGLHFTDVANPQAFRSHPELAWGFYGHRLALYRATTPHAGFGILQRWSQGLAHGSAVFTSNVDGQFQRAGFSPELVLECHGSIHHLQCTAPCSADTWPADGWQPEVDTLACKLLNAPPRCPRCGALARPNILMFGDGQWLPTRTERQESALDRWVQPVRKLVIVEIGAGTAVPSVRSFSQQLVKQGLARLVRINLDEPQVPHALDVGLPMRGLAALQAIDAARRRLNLSA